MDTKTNAISTEDREFLLTNVQHERTAACGWVKNLDTHIQQRMADIYRKHVNGKYVFQKYCSSCVLDLVQRLFQWFRTTEPAEQPTTETKTQTDETNPDSGQVAAKPAGKGSQHKAKEKTTG